MILHISCFSTLSPSAWYFIAAGQIWQGLLLISLSALAPTLQAQDVLTLVSGGQTLGDMPAPQVPGFFYAPRIGMPITTPATVSMSGTFSDMGQSTGPVGTASKTSEMPPQATNQFQRFLKSATCRELPLHGYALFNGQKFSSPGNVLVPASYGISPGDDIDLKLWGSVDVVVRLTVDRNCQVNIPKVGSGTCSNQIGKTCTPTSAASSTTSNSTPPSAACAASRAIWPGTRIMKAHEEFLPWTTLQAKLEQLNEALDVNNVPRIGSLLKEVVPGYQPDGEVVDWVWMENAKAG